MSVQNRRILVTGGAGFIGSHTVERLLEAGHSVRVYDNLSTGALGHLPMGHAGLSVIEADIRDVDALNAAMQGMDACLHLAAQVSVDYSIREPRASAENNVQGFLNVLCAARDAGVKRLVYASSAAVYGDPDRLPVIEPDAGKPISPYGLEKLINEQYAGLFQSLYGISCLGLRYFNTYGPRQDPASAYAGVISIFAQRVQCNEPPLIFGDGQQTRDFIYVGDIADANVAALMGEMDGVCNIGRGESVTLLDLLGTLARIAEQHVEPQLEPPRAGDIRDSCAEVSRMRQELGVNPQTLLEDGLRKLLASSS